MGKTINGELQIADQQFAIVTSRFNHFITSHLANGAEDALLRQGCSEDQITHVWVPGAWELPIVVQSLVASQKYAAILALGCLIRGSTPHFEYISRAVSSELARISTSSGVPVAFGVLTTDTVEQAIERAGSKAGNKGAEAALAAIETLNVLRAVMGS